MNNVVSFNKDKNGSRDLFGAYIRAQNNQRIPEEVFFAAGVILTVGLPELFFSIYGGLLPFIVFASTMLVGVGLGLAINNYKSPYQTLSLSKEPVTQSPTSRKGTTKKAA